MTVSDLESAPEGLEGLAVSARNSFKTIEEMALDTIREAIVRGIYAPGEKLRTETIAAALGISRMPVRASLRHLEAEGLVRLDPHRGARVAVLRASEIAEIFELRILLERHLLALAIPRIDDAALASLQEKLHEADEGEDRTARLDRRREFYDLLYALANRPRTHHQVAQLRTSVARYLLLQRVGDDHGHEALIDALRRRDVAAAQAWLETHLTAVSENLQGQQPE
jgi:DNA-binding GntR family transcriptional regulator